MDALLIMLRNVILFVALALPGFILVKAKLITTQQSGILSKILMYVGMPFLILASTINNIVFDSNLITMIGVVAIIGTVYTFIMYFVSKPLTCIETKDKTRGMMQFAAVFSNNGFLGIPLAMAVFGASSKALMVVIILNIITNICIYTLGVYLISRDKSTISLKKAFLNPVLIAFVLGIVFNLLKVKDYVPEVSTFSTHFSNIVTPISMTILGMKMGDVKFSSIFKTWKMYYVSALKLIVFPVVIVAVLFILKTVLSISVLSVDVVLGVFVAFAMPTAGLSSALSDRYNGDTESAVIFTLGSTILSILTIPILYFIVSLLV